MQILTTLASRRLWRVWTARFWINSIQTRDFGDIVELFLSLTPRDTHLFHLDGYVPLTKVLLSGSWVLQSVFIFTFYRLEQGVFLDLKP